MLRVWIGLAAPLALLAAVQGASSASYGVPIGDSEAWAIVGGAADCGNKWKAGSVSCASGTLLCGTVSAQCSTQSAASLVTDGAGNEVASTNSDYDCKVCSFRLCSKASVINSTKAAKCDDE